MEEKLDFVIHHNIKYRMGRPCSADVGGAPDRDCPVGDRNKPDLGADARELRRYRLFYLVYPQFGSR